MRQRAMLPALAPALAHTLSRGPVHTPDAVCLSPHLDSDEGGHAGAHAMCDVSNDLLEARLEREEGIHHDVEVLHQAHIVAIATLHVEAPGIAGINEAAYVNKGGRALHTAACAMRHT